jgi:SAM-dependent methyltransferase
MNWDAPFYDRRHHYVWQYGADLLPLLAPQAGERILDVGCGTGQLTARIAESGAQVEGFDRSASMVAQASEQFPALTLEVADVTTYTPRAHYDAVFSNAVLHWVRDADAAARTIASALRPGGRMVAEFGGKHNLSRVIDAVSRLAGPQAHPWYFPDLAEYSAVLQRNGLELRQGFLFERMTRMDEPVTGLRDWIRMFGQHWIPAEEDSEPWFRALEDAARPALFQSDGHWWIDYWRIRVVAIKR